MEPLKHNVVTILYMGKPNDDRLISEYICNVDG